MVKVNVKGVKGLFFCPYIGINVKNFSVSQIIIKNKGSQNVTPSPSVIGFKGYHMLCLAFSCLQKGNLGILMDVVENAEKSWDLSSG
jgi:hypothetical protein